MTVIKDLRLFTEVDPDSDITITETTCAFDTMRRDVDAHVSLNYGTDFFTDFVHEFEMRVTANDLGGTAVLWAVVDTPGSVTDMQAAAIGFQLNWNNAGGTRKFALRDLASANSDTSLEPALNTTYYLTITRTGTALQAAIYTDAARTAGFDTLNVVCSASACSSLVVCASAEAGNNPANIITGWVRNFNLANQGFHVYNNAATGVIDYSSLIADLGSGTLAYTSPALAYPATHRFGVRAYNEYGEEQNVDVTRKLTLDAAGADITAKPNAPHSLSVTAAAGGKIQLDFAYDTTGERATCTQFKVYYNSGSGAVDYSSALATVTKATGGLTWYRYTTGALTDGTTYIFAVRANTAGGIEDGNSHEVSATADSTLPTQPASLTVTATR